MLDRGEKLYTVRDLMRLLRLSRSRVHQLLESRNVRTVRVATVLLIPESEAQRLLKEERRPGRPRRKV